MSLSVQIPWWGNITKSHRRIIGDPFSDPLDAFATWFFNSSNTLGEIPMHETVRYIEGVTSVLWYRSGQFQVQQFIMPPNHVVPEHVHPNVDSYEVYGGGHLKLTKNGKWVLDEKTIEDINERGINKAAGFYLRVRPDEWHGGCTGPDGAVFWSVQHWLNGVKPHCVACDYTGPVMGPDHLEQVKHGEATLKENLTKEDIINYNKTK
jgi:hypothetical protein